jgi:hypothetical protein
MDDEGSKRRTPFWFVLQGLGWIFFTFVSLPVVLLWMLSSIVPAIVRVAVLGVGPAALLVLVTAHVPLALQVFALVIATAWLTFLAFQMMAVGGTAERPFLWRSTAEATPAEHILELVNLLVVAVGLFASATFVLVEHQAITVLNWESVENPATASVAFYSWHFLDTVPLLDATSALRWSEPLAYRDPWLGVLLVLFKLVIIVPIVGAVRVAWKSGKAEGSGAPADPA